MKKTTIIPIIIGFTTLGFLFGIIASNYDNLFVNYTQKEESINDIIIDVESLITIQNNEDIDITRNSLKKYIWKDQSFHDDNIILEENISDSRYNEFKPLERIDKFTITMKYGVNSIAYLFLPENFNNNLIIYHHGHDGEFILGKNTIRFFLDRGYPVLALSMPLVGQNNQPIIEHDNFGKLKLIRHNQLHLLEDENFSPIEFFVDPVRISLNHIEKNFNFDSYTMIGVSGGGWTTVLYSAIDQRISQSFSVAGSYPLYLHHLPGNLGDYEQTLPELYNIANYLDLYILSSHGENRKFVQIFNKYDPCCFSGEFFKTYEDEIKDKLLELDKGMFEVYLDDTHKEHKISDFSLTTILQNIEYP